MKSKIVTVLKTLQKLSNNSKLTFEKVVHADVSYNCYGFAAFTHKWFSSLDWINQEEMEYCLNEFSEPTKNPKAGDIMLMKTDAGELMHTGILINPEDETIIHKPGGWAIEVNNVNGAKRIYGNLKITYRRVIPNKKFKLSEFKNFGYTYF